jgi:hypothetical protein
MDTDNRFPVLCDGAAISEGAHPQPNSMWIYGLVDPREPQRIRYVGRASSPAVRYAQHMAGTSQTTRKAEWLAALREAGVSPLMIGLEVVCPSNLSAFRETTWVRELRWDREADLNKHGDREWPAPEWEMARTLRRVLAGYNGRP